MYHLMKRWDKDEDSLQLDFIGVFDKLKFIEVVEGQLVGFGKEKPGMSGLKGPSIFMECMTVSYVTTGHSISA